ncbi:MFS transporter [Bombilactobacillus folatiphilus]|uniref:MFS transporter n=1 Tax=Bombilactobacillus folatiphilus TaxID=2923362 RepID=A0ABY4P8W0_9LACO|nr:MFS transporter [Bombilactobacillus folatiphilus]UQS82030.1 MFS transporter [Bombilactobacillus folatiphilus]
MRNLKKMLKNQSYLQNSFTLLLFFASWGVWWSIFQLWLTSKENGLGLSGGAVGTIYSADSFVTLCLMFIYGTLQDKLVIKRYLLIFCAILDTLIGPFFVWIYAPLLHSNFVLGMILGALFLSAGFLSASGIFEAVTEKMSRRFDFEYGQARSWGSFGYALVALLAGYLSVIDPRINFWCASGFGLILLLNLLLWVPKVEKQADKKLALAGESSDTPSLRDMLGLLKLKSLWVIIIFIMFSYTFYTVFDQQMFPSFYTSLFANRDVGQQMYGTLNSVQVFCEALMMSLVPILMRKVGVRNALLMGVIVMFVRIGACGLFHSPIAISCVKMLHSIEVPLFSLPIFRYFTLHFDTKLSATLYMIGFQVAAQIGQFILSTPLGMLRDKLGYSPTFLVISGIVLISGIYAFVILKKDDQDVEGDPFVRS